MHVCGRRDVLDWCFYIGGKAGGEVGWRALMWDVCGVFFMWRKNVKEYSVRLLCTFGKFF